MPSNRRNKDVPDLFEGVSTPRSGSPSVSSQQRRFVLPGNLAGAVKTLDDYQLDTLLKTVTAEAKRRGRLPTEKHKKPVPKKKPKAAPVQVPQGKANLIRAAIKAGVKPGAIARQLGVSPSVVQHVLKEKPGA
jgi:hypothetical protein